MKIGTKKMLKVNRVNIALINVKYDGRVSMILFKGRIPIYFRFMMHSRDLMFLNEHLQFFALPFVMGLYAYPRC